MSDLYYYILDENHNIVECDLMTWARWLEDEGYGNNEPLLHVD